jgi:hypothetical protein
VFAFSFAACPSILTQRLLFTSETFFRSLPLGIGRGEKIFISLQNQRSRKHVLYTYVQKNKNLSIRELSLALEQLHQELSLSCFIMIPFIHHRYNRKNRVKMLKVAFLLLF